MNNKLEKRMEDFKRWQEEFEAVHDDTPDMGRYEYDEDQSVREKRSSSCIYYR